MSQTSPAKNREEEYLSQLEPCPVCGGTELRWCSISVRPYCSDCNHWGRVNYHMPDNAVREWNEHSHRANRRATERRNYPRLVELIGKSVNYLPGHLRDEAVELLHDIEGEV